MSAALAISGLLVSGIVISPVSAAPVAAAQVEQSEDDVVQINDETLAEEPQLLLEGTLLVTATETSEAEPFAYHVTSADGESVPVSGDFGHDASSGSTFVGTVAIPADVAATVDVQFTEEIAQSADTPVNADSAAGEEILAAVSAGSETLEVVSASVQPAVAPAQVAMAHTVEVAIVGSYTDAEVASLVAGLNSFWSTQSDGVIPSVTRVGTTARYASSASPCDYWGIWQEAAKRLHPSSTGYNYYLTNSGAHLLVISNAGCPAAGVGTVGGSVHFGGLVWANVSSSLDLHTIAHEFGHNLGLGHSNVHSCPGSTLVEGTSAQGCADKEYSDYFDVMAGGFIYGSTVSTNKLAALNVTAKNALGFLRSGSLLSVSATGSVSLRAASEASGVRGLRIVDPTSGQVYFVEYRAGAGMDSGAFYTSSATKPQGMGVGVRILTSRAPGNGSATSGASVAFLQALVPGQTYRSLSLGASQTYSSPTGSFRVTVQALSATEATLQVQFGPAAPVPDPEPNPEPDPEPVSNTLQRDFSGDGKPDVLVRTILGAVRQYKGNGAGGFESSAVIGSGWTRFNHVFSAGDFSGDGKADVMARDASGLLWLYRGNGTGGWGAVSVVGSGWGGFTALFSPGDFDGDTFTDVLARDAAGVLWVYPGNGTGGWKTPYRAGAGWNMFNTLFAVGDFSGDGISDIMGRDARGFLYLYRPTGSGGWQSGGTIVGSGWGGFTAVFGAGDFSGDGKTDVMARDLLGRLWLYAGNGASGWGKVTMVGSGWNTLSFIV